MTDFLKWEGGADYRYAFGPGIVDKDFFYQVIGQTGGQPYHSKVVKICKHDMSLVAEWTSVVTCNYGEGHLIFGDGKLYVSNAGYTHGRIDEIDLNTMRGTGRFWDGPSYEAASSMAYNAGHLYFGVNTNPGGGTNAGFFKLRLSDMSIVAAFSPSNNYKYMGIKYDIATGYIYGAYRDSANKVGYAVKLNPEDMRPVSRSVAIDQIVGAMKAVTLLGSNFYVCATTNYPYGGAAVTPYEIYKFSKATMSLESIFKGPTNTCESIDNDGTYLYCASVNTDIIDAVQMKLQKSIRVDPIQRPNQISINDGFAYCIVESSDFATIYKVPLSEFGGVTPIPDPIPVPNQEIREKLNQLKIKIQDISVNIDNIISNL